MQQNLFTVQTESISARSNAEMMPSKFSDSSKTSTPPASLTSSESSKPSMLSVSKIDFSSTTTPLYKLKNAELEHRLKSLVQQERRLLHLILLHIKEVDSRKLYLEKAYPSLFEYLVKELGYSGSAAQRRIEAARLLMALPKMTELKIAESIRTGSLNLSQIGEVARPLKKNKKKPRPLFLIIKRKSSC